MIQSRIEQYLAYLAGESDTYPTDPFTRSELYLYALCEAGGLGGTGVTPEEIQTAVDNYLAEHPVQATPIDDTLTQAGEAADAKATGDAIAELKNELANLRQLIIDTTQETEIASGIVDAGTEVMTEEEVQSAYNKAEEQ